MTRGWGGGVGGVCVSGVGGPPSVRPGLTRTNRRLDLGPCAVFFKGREEGCEGNILRE